MGYVENFIKKWLLSGFILNFSNKKFDLEVSVLKKKVNKGKIEGFENLDLDKTSLLFFFFEEDEDLGV